MKRAALIITDADLLRVTYYDGPLHLFRRKHEPSEQLLADLWTVHNLALIGLGEQYGVVDTGPLARAVARVRALLPEDEIPPRDE